MTRPALALVSLLALAGIACGGSTPPAPAAAPAPLPPTMTYADAVDRIEAGTLCDRQTLNALVDREGWSVDQRSALLQLLSISCLSSGGRR